MAGDALGAMPRSISASVTTPVPGPSSNTGTRNGGIDLACDGAGECRARRRDGADILGPGDQSTKKIEMLGGGVAGHDVPQ